MVEAPARIVIVEDDVGKRYTTSRLLRAAGFEVLEAVNGAEGIALVQDIPDLVIMDIKLPDVSGLDLCRQIKTTPEMSSILVLLLSAQFTSAPQRARGLEHGADAYLVHPVDGDELIATVRALLRLRRSERDRARLSAQIAEGERRYRTITETTTVGLCVIDAEGACRFVNRAAELMLGRSGPAVMGRRLHDVLAPQALDGTVIPYDQWQVTRMLADGAPVPSRRETVHGVHTSRLHVELSANLILDGEQGSGAVVEIKDIEALVRAERQRDLFLATLGHDLRGPLQTISFGASMLLDAAGLDARASNTVKRMQTNAQKMERLIEHILVFARTLVEGVPLVPRSVDLIQICSAVVREAAAREPLRALELTGLSELFGTWDPDRLAQVVENLVANALRHGEGLITIDVAQEAGRALVTIHNLGRPIPSDAIATLFDPFRRATTGGGGVGLGLYIVDQNVRAHGGTVGVVSNAEHGTSFRVRLPVEPRA